MSKLRFVGLDVHKDTIVVQGGSVVPSNRQTVSTNKGLAPKATDSRLTTVSAVSKTDPP